MASSTLQRVLIAGVSTRALAVSAARAGYQVAVIDAFGDLDLHAVAEVKALRREQGTEFRPMAAAALAQTLPAEMVAYTSNFENYPAAVDRLQQSRLLLGNSPAVLHQVRDPLALFRALRRRGFTVPASRATRPSAPRNHASWLLKPRRSGGGHGTVRWHGGRAVPRTHYLQEWISGAPGSISFVADGRNSVPLGLSRQIVGDAAFGASGFRYCGSLQGSPAALFPQWQELIGVATRLASAVTEKFRVVGLNGIDFVVRNGIPYPIEVNPRYSASMELVERAQKLSLFDVHVRACQGKLPPTPPEATHVEGKAIVFARHDTTLGNTRRWLQDASFADVPHPGEKILRSHPICTVFARAADADTCYTLLTRRAARVYRFAASTRRSAA